MISLGLFCSAGDLTRLQGPYGSKLTVSATIATGQMGRAIRSVVLWNTTPDSVVGTKLRLWRMRERWLVSNTCDGA